MDVSVFGVGIGIDTGQVFVQFLYRASTARRHRPPKTRVRLPMMRYLRPAPPSAAWWEIWLPLCCAPVLPLPGAPPAKCQYRSCPAMSFTLLNLKENETVTFDACPWVGMLRNRPCTGPGHAFYLDLTGGASALCLRAEVRESRLPKHCGLSGTSGTAGN